MKKVRITVMRMAEYRDLMAQYENPLEHACDMALGQSFIAEGWAKPEGFCDSAWETLSPFVLTLAHGGENFYGGWTEKPPFGDALLQRRLPPGQLPAGGAGRRGVKPSAALAKAGFLCYTKVYLNLPEGGSRPDRC